MSSVGREARAAEPRGHARELDPDHPLVVLAGMIDWTWLEHASDPVGLAGADPGRFSTKRSMMGLHLLRHIFGLPESALVELCRIDPNFNHFAGVDGEPPRRWGTSAKG